MSDPRELYQQIIIEHNKNPKNYGDLACSNHHAHGMNPLCGDDITVKLWLENGIIKDISFQGHGCAISKASSSLMTVSVKGKSIEEVELIIMQFRDMIRGNLDTNMTPNSLGRLKIFQNISILPSRVKCAVLPWATLHSALQGQDTACTE